MRLAIDRMTAQQAEVEKLQAQLREALTLVERARTAGFAPPETFVSVEIADGIMVKL